MLEATGGGQRGSVGCGSAGRRRSAVGRGAREGVRRRARGGGRSVGGRGAAGNLWPGALSDAGSVIEAVLVETEALSNGLHTVHVQYSTGRFV